MNNNNSPIFKIYAFLRTDYAKQLNSVDRALLHAIVGYIGMSPQNVCKARHILIMRDSGIKSNTSYGVHLRKLQTLKLIKTVEKGKMNHHYLGEYFDHDINNCTEKSRTGNVHESVVKTVKDGKRPWSRTGNVHGQGRETSLTIDIENIEKENIDNNISLTTVTTERSKQNLKNNSDNKNIIITNFTNSKFEEFIEIFPKKTKRHLCLKFWQDNNLDNSASEIISDVKNRMKAHEPWVRNLKAGTIQYLPNPFDYLYQEQYREPIIYTITTKKEIDSGYQRCFTKKQNTIFSRLQEKIEKSYIIESNAI